VFPVRKRLFEREEEIGRLEGLIHHARSGEGGAAFVVGPPGIGKSRLIDEAVALAEYAGLRVLRADAHPGERDFPFGVVHQLFDVVVRGEGGAALLDGPAATARPLFEPEAGVPAHVDDGLYPLLHGLYWLAVNLAQPDPVLLVVDDVQWVDVASLRFLVYLIHRCADSPVVVVLGLRPDADAPDAELLEELGTHRSITILEPRPLSSDAVAELVSGELPDATAEFSEACARSAGGNPFLVVELLHSLPEEVTGSPAEVALVAGLAPRAVVRAVHQRLARLPQATWDLAAAVAVLGGPVDLGLAARVAGHPAEEVTTALDRLITAHVLEQEGGGGLRFVHDVVAQAVLAELAPGRRAELELRAAVAHHERGSAAPQIAAQLLHTPGTSEVWAVDALRETAEQARREGVPDTAVRYLRRAMDEDLADPELRGVVLAELGEAESLLGFDEAVVHLEAAVPLVAGGRRAAVLLALGRAQSMAGHAGAAVRSFAAAAESAVDPDVRAMAEADWALSLMVGRTDVGDVAAGDPSAVPDPDLPEPGASLSAGARASLARVAFGRFRVGAPHAEVVALARRSYDNGRLVADGGARSLATVGLAAVVSWSGELELGLELLDALVADARATGDNMALASATCLRAWLLLEVGRLREALVDIETALEARSFRWAQLDDAATAVAAWIHLAAGDHTTSAEVLATFPDDHARIGLAALVAGARGDLASARGDHGQALGLYRRAGRLLDAAGLHNPAAFPWRSRAAHAAHAIGDDAAVELAREELRLAESIGTSRSLCRARLAMAAVVEPDEALVYAESAATGVDPACVLDQLQALVAEGGALVRVGRRDEGGDRLHDVLATAERIGAQAVAELARRELNAAGFRPRRGARSGVEALTPSERRVTELAAAGRSNREIADLLYVTIKTVEFHLGNAYNKCGVRTRGDLAALLDASPHGDDGQVPSADADRSRADRSGANQPGPGGSGPGLSATGRSRGGESGPGESDGGGSATGGSDGGESGPGHDTLSTPSPRAS
jgi:DNA-binding CsgD family transcriptional regulator